MLMGYIWAYNEDLAYMRHFETCYKGLVYMRNFAYRMKVLYNWGLYEQVRDLVPEMWMHVLSMKK